MTPSLSYIYARCPNPECGRVLVLGINWGKEGWDVLCGLCGWILECSDQSGECSEYDGEEGEENEGGVDPSED